MSIGPRVLSKPAFLVGKELAVILLLIIVLPFLFSKLAAWRDKRRE